MKKTILISFTALLLFTSNAIADNYQEEVALTNITITEIVAKSSINVEIHKAVNISETMIVLCSELGDFQGFEYSIAGNTLYLSEKATFDNRRKRRNWRDEDEYQDKKLVKVYIMEFNDFECSGSSDIVVVDSFNCPKLSIIASSSSDIVFAKEITVSDDVSIIASNSSDVVFQTPLTISGDLSIDSSGSSDVKFNNVRVDGDMDISGESASDILLTSLTVTGDFEAYLSGSSDFILNEQTVGSLIARCSSYSDYEVGKLRVEHGVMNVNMSGSSDFEIDEAEVLNNSEFNKISTSSSSSFDGENAKMAMAEVSTSGSSDIIINASQILSILNVTGSSDLHYVGNSGLEIKKDSSVRITGTIKKI